MGPTAASILSTLEPVVTVGLAFVVFGESLGPAQLAGGALVLQLAVLAVPYRHRRSSHDQPLEGKVALVAGATRGAGRGIAVALGEAGATVYCTGRSTREQRSEYDRPETIEETAELVDRRRRHRDRGRRSTTSSPTRSRRSCGGSTPSRAGSTCWSTTSGAASGCSSGTRRCGSTTSTTGLRMLRLAIDTHLITSHFALPLLIRRPGGLVVEMTDGTREYNDANYRVLGVLRPRQERGDPARVRPGPGARAARLHRRGAHAGLAALGDDARELRRHRGELARRRGRNPHFAAISESPRFVGRAVAALAADPDVQRRNGGSFSSGGLAREYGFTDVDGSQPDCWRYMVEVQDAGLPADPTGYR